MSAGEADKVFADWLVEEPPPPHVGPMVRAEVERIRRLEAEGVAAAVGQQIDSEFSRPSKREILSGGTFRLPD